MTTVTHLEYFVDVLEEYEKYRRAYRIGADMQAEAMEAGNSGENSNQADQMLSKAIDKLLGGVKTSAKSVQEMHAEHIEKRMRAKREGVVGLSIALEPLRDVIASWEAPDCVVVATKSSNGKTAFMLSELLPQAMSGVPVGIYETDMTTEQLYERFAGNLASVNMFTFKKKYWTQDDAVRVDDAYKALYNAPIHVCDKPNSTIGDIQFFGTLCGIKHKCRLFAMDFLTQLEFTKDELRQPTRTVIGHHSGKIKGIGKRYDMVTYILSQIGRYGDKTSEVTPAIPNKEVLKESGDIENNADIVIMIGMEPDRPIEEFTFKHNIWDMKTNVDKQRQGPTGIIDMAFEPRYQQFISRDIGDIRRIEYQIATEGGG